VARMYSICSLVAALAIGGYIFTAHAGNGTTQQQASQDVAQAVQVAGASSFRQAALALEAHRVESGTYAGTDLSGYGGVALVRADTAAYCIQVGAGTAALHQTSTDAAAAPGPC
jgi:hypothetical protein